MGDVVVAEADPTTGDVPGPRQEPEQGRDERRLARAGLADDRDALAAADVEVDAVQDLAVTEGDPQVADGQQGVGPVGLVGLEARCGPGGRVAVVHGPVLSVLRHSPVLLAGWRRRP